MATLSIVSFSPRNHVLQNGSGVTIKFVRNSTSFNTVRIRLAKNGMITSGNVVVFDATSYTTFSGATGITTLSYTTIMQQGQLEYGVTYSIDITCFDTAPAVLDWTQVTTFALFYTPVITELTPATGTTMDGYPLDVAWVVSPNGMDGVLSSQRLTVYDATSQAYVYDESLDPTTRDVTLGLDDIQLVSGQTYYVAIECVNDVGLSARSEHNFDTYWEPPLEPTATVAFDEESLGATITVHAGEDVSDWLIRFVGTDAVVRDGYLTIQGTDATIDATYTVADGNIQFDNPAAPATQSLMLVRVNPDGTRWVVATGLNSGDTVQDPLPPLGVEYQYEVTAVDANGSTNVSAVSMTIETGCWAFNFGDTAQEHVKLRYNPKTSFSIDHGGEAYHFADGGEGNGLPVFYPTTDRDISGSGTWDTKGYELADAIAEITMRHPVGWMRDPYGHRRRAHMRWSFQHGVPARQKVTISLDWDEMRFREAW